MSRQKYRFGERQTLRAAGFPEACVGWPCWGLTAAPPTGRSGDDPDPWNDLGIPPGPPPRTGCPQEAPAPVRPPCLRSETPLHPLPPPLRIAGRASLPCNGTRTIMEAVPARMARDAVFLERRADSAGCRRGICRQSVDCQQYGSPPCSRSEWGGDGCAAVRSSPVPMGAGWRTHAPLAKSRSLRAEMMVTMKPASTSSMTMVMIRKKVEVAKPLTRRKATRQTTNRIIDRA